MVVAMRVHVWDSLMEKEPDKNLFQSPLSLNEEHRLIDLEDLHYNYFEVFCQFGEEEFI